MPLTVTLYNLSVKLEAKEKKHADLIESFIERYYTSKGMSFSGTGEDSKKYYSRINNTWTYYLHTNQFLHLLHHCKTLGVDLIAGADRVDERHYHHQSHDYEVRDDLSLRDYQEEIDKFLTTEPIKGSRMVSLQTGKGKAQPLSSKIKTPTGWITMGKAKVGDKVMASDSTVCKITGVFPQGTRAVYKVTLRDGRVCSASDEHLWTVYVKDTHTDNIDKRTITTLELKDLLYRQDITVHLPQITPFDNKGKHTPSLTPSAIAPTHMDGSIHQRYTLLTQLLTQGKLTDKKSHWLFESTHYLLCTQVQYLVRSLAGLATFEQERKPGKKYATIKIAISTIPINDYEGYLSQLQESKLIQVTQVAFSGHDTVQCIKIDHPSELYITDDFIVTHNTMISLWSLAKIKMRIGIVVLATYVDKWMSDIVTVHKATRKDVMLVQGSKSIRGIVNMARDGEIDCRYFIFSSRTMQEFVTSYEQDPEQTILLYGCSPLELFPLLGIGSLLIDETHQQFHAIFKILLHTNVKYQVGLSATLMSDDSVVSRVHKIVYPDKFTFSGLALDKYSDVYALSYSIPMEYIRHIKTSNYGSNAYSHTAYEQSVIKHPQLKSYYLSIIDNTLTDFYIDRYEPKDKCIIFVATVKLATLLTERYRQLHPDKITNRYCEEDPFDNLYSADIIVSTVISAGTAVDIPELRVVVQTVSISSPVSNIQVLGRLRKLTGGRDTRFCYIYAENLNKQRQYHYKRIDLFRDRVATHKSLRVRAGR